MRGLSGRGKLTRPWTRKVCSDHGLRSEARSSMCREGRPQERVGSEFQLLVIGHGTAWRPVNGSRATAPLGGGWKAVWEGGCCCIGGRLGARSAKGRAEAGMLEGGGLAGGLPLSIAMWWGWF